jgi:hypothetical protein
MTENPETGSWIRGRLALAGVDLRTSASTWLDAVYALWIDQPGDGILAKAHRQLVIASAKLMPDRETWGALPEQQALGVARMTGGTAGQAAPRLRNGSTRPD